MTQNNSNPAEEGIREARKQAQWMKEAKDILRNRYRWPTVYDGSAADYELEGQMLVGRSPEEGAKNLDEIYERGEHNLATEARS